MKDEGKEWIMESQQTHVLPDALPGLHPSSFPAPMALPAPMAPRVPIEIRPAAMDDLSFIDSLQKMHTKMVGWMPRKQLEEKIGRGQVIVARASRPCSGITGETPVSQGECAGYCIAHDQYFKRDDVGIIYQMNVIPGRQRGLIGAALLKAQFERSAYGCRLYCCWCAQDIEANRFWEAMGFVPLAFRAGSEKRDRVHIFWQKRIRKGDTITPWWFPSKTSGGSIREDRIVLPIPLGMRWDDEMPRILPSEKSPKQLNEPEHGRDARATKKAKPAEAPAALQRNGLRFDIPQQGNPLPEAVKRNQVRSKAPREKRVCDPRLAAAARELRDRWLEQVNADSLLIAARGKYAVGRALRVIDAPNAAMAPQASQLINPGPSEARVSSRSPGPKCPAAEMTLTCAESFP
jgi:hypothetical protein